MEAGPVSLMLTLNKYLPADIGLFNCKVAICKFWARVVLWWIIWCNIVFSWKVILWVFSPKFEFLSQISAGFSNVTEVSEDVKRTDITY